MPRPFIPVIYGVKAELRYTLFGQKIENVLHFTGQSAAGEATLMALGAAIVAWYGTYLAPIMPEEVVLNSIKLTALDTPTAPSVEYTDDMPLPGEVTGGCAPSGTTMAVRLGTFYRGRSATGRLFFPAIANANIVGNQVDSSWRTAVQLAFTALIAAVQTEDFIWTVVSYVTNKAFRTTGLANMIASVTIDPWVDSQRRRLTGRGQ